MTAKKASAPKAEEVAATEPKPDRLKCFVIMPFGDRPQAGDPSRYRPGHWTEVYEQVLAPAADKAKCDVTRDDQDRSTRSIVNGIWRKIESADVVLCDVSSWNPNVFLELGWALRADKRVVLVHDDHTKFAFDISHIYHSQYASSMWPSRIADDRARIAEAIESTIARGTEEYSAVWTLGLESALGSLEKWLGGTRDGAPFIVTLLQQVESHLAGLRDAGASAQDGERAVDRTPAAPVLIGPVALPRIWQAFGVGMTLGVVRLTIEWWVGGQVTLSGGDVGSASSVTGVVRHLDQSVEREPSATIEFDRTGSVLAGATSAVFSADLTGGTERAPGLLSWTPADPLRVPFSLGRLQMNSSWM